MTILTRAALVIVALALPISAFAASLTTAPANVSRSVGETFTVTVTADPGGTKAYTVRANVAFDPSKVEFVSFSFAPKWVPLSQTGYDTENNSGGVLVKTAGYPSGIAAATAFGTATFRVKASGSSTVRITSESLALDASGKNLIAGTQGSTNLTVAAQESKPEPTPVPPPAPKKPAQETAAPETMSAEVATTSMEATTSESATNVATETPAVAAVGATGALGSWWLWGIGALALLVAAGIWYWRRLQVRGQAY